MWYINGLLPTFASLLPDPNRFLLIVSRRTTSYDGGSRQAATRLLQYAIVVLQHQHNLVELALNKSMSSGEGEREEIIGGSGSHRRSVCDGSLACMASYLWNSVDEESFNNFVRMPPMFDELLDRAGPRITKQNRPTTYRVAIGSDLKFALIL